MDRNGIVRLLKGNNQNAGTGFFVSDSLILTCYHVVEDASLNVGDKLSYITISGSNSTSATVESVYQNIDIALLRSTEKSNVFYRLKDTALTIGFPGQFKEPKSASPSFQCVISDIKIQLGSASSITEGFSGAPLFDDEGAVVAVIRGISGVDEYGKGVNDATAIPASAILSTMKDYECSTKVMLDRDEVEAYLDSFISQYNPEVMLGLINLRGIEQVITSTHRSYMKSKLRLHRPSLGRMPVQQHYVVKDEERGNQVIITDVLDTIERSGRKVVLLGEPGCGKTVSTIRLAWDYAQRRREDENAPIPIYIPLGSYKEDCTLEEYIFGECTGNIIRTGYRSNIDKFFFIFDALNELEVAKKASVLQYIKGLDHFAVSCRQLDYRSDLSDVKDMCKITILDFDLDQITKFIDNYFDNANSRKKLKESLGINIYLEEFWKATVALHDTDLFWTDPASADFEKIQSLNIGIDAKYAWENVHRIGLLKICKSPLLLFMVCSVFFREKNCQTLTERFSSDL